MLMVHDKEFYNTQSAHIYTKYQTDSYCVKLCIVFFFYV